MDKSALTIGEVISRARAEKNISYAELENLSRIREALIKKIERNDLGDGELSTYTRGHIRTLATLVGVDRALIEKMISDYCAAFEVNNSLIDNLREEQVVYSKPKRSLPAISYKSLGLVAGIIIFAMFAVPVFGNFINSHHKATKVLTKSSTKTSQPNSTGSSSNITLNGNILASADKGVNLTVTGINDKSWIGIQDSSGNQVFSGFIGKGQVQNFTDPASLQLVIGNAGAVDLNLNGKDLGSPGGINQVVHLTFTPQGAATPTTATNS
jgi:cytoskeleton protein RodZ